MRTAVLDRIQSGFHQDDRTDVTRDWTSRRLDFTSTDMAVGNGFLLGYARSWDSTTARASGSGVAGYALDGSPRFRVLDGAPGLVQIGSGLGYAWPAADESDGRVTIFDLASGGVVRAGTVPEPVFLLSPS